MATFQPAIRRGFVPPGGTEGQVLTKNSSGNWDYEWADSTGGGGGGGGDIEVIVDGGGATPEDADFEVIVDGGNP